MFKEEILENSKRREIFTYIEKNPGVHLRALQRALGLPLGSAEYHVDYMVKRGVLIRERKGRYTRFYARELEPADKGVLSTLRQRKLREILLFALPRKKVKYKTLLNAMKVPPSTLSLYLKKLVDQNILRRHKVGYETIYTVLDEDRVARLLVSYKSSFIDRLVDRTLSVWLETKFREAAHE
ncbi:MAG: hypothetical protein JSV35_07995 [Candidatus Bathyarchaeota archaeon]|nr:MAG: hypothetical protein JSV35_07995 [Candidatus Bathyarchaeota archaeon]